MIDSVTEVAAAVIFDGSRILACQRPAGKPLAGYWEFPGGKLENDETPAAALARELREELALEVQIQHSMYRMEFAPEAHRKIVLHFLRCNKIPGSSLCACENQQFRWLEGSELDSVNWLPSDAEFVDFLRMIFDQTK